jgi:hypothetical protein
MIVMARETQNNVAKLWNRMDRMTHWLASFTSCTTRDCSRMANLQQMEASLVRHLTSTKCFEDCFHCITMQCVRVHGTAMTSKADRPRIVREEIQN